LAEDLVRHFSDVEALRGVSFAVPEGSVLGLLGPNGAGKTTAVRILTTLLRPTSGRAEVLGLDVTAEPVRTRMSIGLAGQSTAVDEKLTGRENLRLVGRLTHLPAAEMTARANDLLEQFDLVDAANRILQTYSGGMRRRLDLAAALMHRPPVLFLDEPTTGLDPRSRTDLWAVIERLVEEGTTVLLTTQYLEEADRLADHIVVIDQGLVIAEGTSTELKARLGATVIEIAFTDTESVEHAVGSLAGLGDVTVQGHELHLCVADGASAMLAAVRALDAAKLEPVTMALHEPTLDDVFLSLTGHAAEMQADDTEPADDQQPPPRGRLRRSRARA
ncbi:MAG TPA: ATP-binding cassette domain-containing protein, partial [Acidimicrobiia bacterium]|nr:ATP-binding cassette domain-containing protein [Acidimicrobiia bacterium]